MSHDKIIEQYEKAISEARMEAEQNKLRMIQTDMSQHEPEQGMIKEQLDVNEILENVHHLLQGDILKRDIKDGRTKWFPADSNDLRVFTEYGISTIMSAVQWYVNKNTLLSNYDDQQIMSKMEDFANTLNDSIFMEYDKIFLYPTLEDCKDEIESRIQNKIDIKQFAQKLSGLDFDEAKTRQLVIKEMENRIDNELRTIREQKIKNKLKRFESIIRYVQDTVHSAYQRAWKGQERTTLRQHIHISENKGGVPVLGQQRNSWNPFAK